MALFEVLFWCTSYVSSYQHILISGLWYIVDTLCPRDILHHIHIGQIVVFWKIKVLVYCNIQCIVTGGFAAVNRKMALEFGGEPVLKAVGQNIHEAKFKWKNNVVTLFYRFSTNLNYSLSQHHKKVWKNSELLDLTQGLMYKVTVLLAFIAILGFTSLDLSTMSHSPFLCRFDDFISS